MIFTSQIALDLSLSKYVSPLLLDLNYFSFTNFNNLQLQIVLMNGHIFFF